MRWHLLCLSLGLAACHHGRTTGAAAPPPSPSASTARPAPTAGAQGRRVTGVEWKLVELDGHPTPLGAGGQSATLLLADSGGRASGFAGCNRIAGSFDLHGDTLRFGPLVSTRMACETGMDLEQQYAAALERTRRYRRAPEGLELLGDEGVVARFRNSAADPCASAVTTVEMRRCLGDALTQAETELAEDVRRARELANPPEAFDSAQTAWSRYRDAECAVEGSRYEGGTAAPVSEMACRLALTRERTARIRLALVGVARPTPDGAARPGPDSAARDSTADGAAWTVLLRRVGPVRFGMRIADAEQALGAHFDGVVSRTECTYARTPTMPAGLRFMMERGRIVRADVDTKGIRTGSGAEVGMTEAEIRRLYPGQIRTQPHKYTGPEGHYLIYTPLDASDRRYGLIFETNGMAVTRYRTGLRPAVEYVEGCS